MKCIMDKALGMSLTCRFNLNLGILRDITNGSYPDTNGFELTNSLSWPSTFTLPKIRKITHVHILLMLRFETTCL